MNCMNSRATCLMGESHHQEALQEAERVLETKEGENFHVDAMFVKAEALFLQCKVDCCWLFIIINLRRLTSI